MVDVVANAPSVAPCDLLGDGRLFKEVLAAGDGTFPAEGGWARIHYRGDLVGNNSCFETEPLDSSRARDQMLTFSLGEFEVIPGLETGVASMRVGERAAFTVHPDLAYGFAGCGGGVIPGASVSDGIGSKGGAVMGAIRLEVELLEVGGSSSHMSDEATDALSSEERLQRAMRAKDAGNVDFKAGKMELAAFAYESALKFLGCLAAQEGEDGGLSGVHDPDDAHWADEARRECRNKLALSCFLNLAQCELRSDRLHEAALHASKALSLDPSNSKAVYRRGLAHMGIGLLKQAREDLMAAARREPRSSEVRAQLQACQKRLQASEQQDRSAFEGMFHRGSLYGEKVEAPCVRNLDRLAQVFLRFEVEGRGLAGEGRVEFALYEDTAPKAAESFRLLCQGTSAGSAEAVPSRCYRGSLVHRLVKGSVLQGGHLGPSSGEEHGRSIARAAFGHEPFGGRHDRRGFLSLAKHGEEVYGSQFLITLAAAPHFDGDYVIIGEVIAGWDALGAIEGLEVDQEEHPSLPVSIADCGLIPSVLGFAPGAPPATLGVGGTDSAGSRACSEAATTTAVG
mmetsp:Transcript_121693/g.306138  ORF Transcript_121693/g.306138 Transcript_121693/m.306138 type:complete len:568 (+) Transcript_121693:30-1733(+)